MPTDPAVTLLTARDLDVLAALDMAPLTAGQLCKLSRTFDQPFPDARRVRERLRTLAEVGRVRAFRYATAGPGAPVYYVLTPLGYRLLHGQDATLPARRQFGPVGIARQRHTLALAEFLVHTAVAAYAAGVRLAHFRRENAVRLDVGEETIYPDAAFQLVTREGRALNFLVELDCGTERVRSGLPTDSWERKVRLYERYADGAPTRFRVLAVCTGGQGRVGNVLAVAKHAAKNPHRSLVYGVSLPAYLTVSDALSAPVWGNHSGTHVSLLAGQPARSGLVWLPWLGWNELGEKLGKRVEIAFAGPILVSAVLILLLLALELLAGSPSRGTPGLALSVGVALVWVVVTTECVLGAWLHPHTVAFLKARRADVLFVFLPVLAFSVTHWWSPDQLVWSQVTALSAEQLVARREQHSRLQVLLARLWSALAIFASVARTSGHTPEKRLESIPDEIAEHERCIAERERCIAELREEAETCRTLVGKRPATNP